MLESYKIKRKYKFNYVLYLAAESSFNGLLFEQEKELIIDIAKQLNNYGIKLIIKPHPFGLTDDYDDISNKLNVVIAKKENNLGSQYFFSHDDNSNRINLIQNAKFVINMGTTLVLETSLLNMPILQLKIQKKEFPLIYEAQKNEHIKKFILNRNDVYTLNNCIKNFISNKDNMNFSIYLKKWIGEPNDNNILKFFNDFK